MPRALARLLAALLALLLVAADGATAYEGGGPPPAADPTWYPVDDADRTAWHRVTVAPDGSELYMGGRGTRVAHGGRVVVSSYDGALHPPGTAWSGAWLHEPGVEGLTFVSYLADGTPTSVEAMALSSNGRHLAFATTAYPPHDPETGEPIGDYRYLLVVRDLGDAATPAGSREVVYDGDLGYIGGLDVADDGTVVYAYGPTSQAPAGTPTTYHRIALDGTTSLLGDSGDAMYPTSPSVSPDGRFASWPRFVLDPSSPWGTGTWSQVLRDVTADTELELPLSTDDTPDRYFGRVDITTDGTTLAYTPDTGFGSGLVTVDLTGFPVVSATEHPLDAQSPPLNPFDATLTDDARTIVFTAPHFDGSTSSDQLFRYDVDSGEVTLLSHSGSGHPATSDADYTYGEGSISPDGTAVAFHTSLQLVDGDTNRDHDVFLTELVPAEPAVRAWPEGAVLEQTDATATSVSLAWPQSTVADIVGYQLTRDGGVVDTFPVEITNATVTGLPSDRTSTYRLRGLTASGFSSDSLVTAASTTPGDGEEVGLVELSASETGAGAVRLTWSLGDATDVTGFLVERAEADTEFTALPTEPSPLTPATTTFTDTSVQPGVAYAYVVTALTASGSRQHSTLVGLTTGELAVDSVRIPGLSTDSELTPGANLSVEVRGTPNRAARARLTFVTSLSPDGDVLAEPSTQTVSLDLASQGGGRYLGTTTVPVGAQRLTAVQGRIEQGGNEAVANLGSPLPVDIHASADASLGRVVTLTWPAATGARIDGYRITRTINGGAPVEAGEVPADVTSFTDPRTPSGGTRVYTVELVGTSGAVAPWATSGELVVPEATLDAVEVTRDGDPNYLARGERIDVVAIASSGASVIAEVQTRTWRGEDDRLLDTSTGPRQVTVPVTLVEDDAQPGTYRGSFTVDDDLADVGRVEAVLVDGDDVRRRSWRGSLPAVETVANVTIADQGVLDGAVLRVTKGWGGQPEPAVPVAPGTTYTFGGLTERILFEVIDTFGDRLVNEAFYPVEHPGRTVDVELVPTDVRVLRGRVLAPGGTPYETWMLIEGPDGGYLGSARSGEDGTFETRLEEPDGLPDELVVIVGAPWDRPWAETRIVVPVDRQRTLDATVQMTAPAAGTTTGTVRVAGTPRAGLTVRVNQPHVGAGGHHDETTTGPDGTYELPSYAGPARVTVSGRGLPAQTSDVVVGDDGNLTNDLELDAPVTYVVDPAVTTRQLDAAAVPASVDLLRGGLFNVALRLPGSVGYFTGLPVEMVGYPGDVLTVCADPDFRTGMMAACAELDLPASGTERLTPALDLVAPGRLRGVIVDGGGAPVAATVLVLAKDGRTVARGQSSWDDGSFELPVSSTEAYTLVANAWVDGPRRAVRSLREVSLGEGHDLGTLVLRADGRRLDDASSLDVRRGDVAPGQLAGFGSRLRLRSALPEGVEADTLVVSPPTGGVLVTDSLTVAGESVAPEVGDDGTWTVALPPLSDTETINVAWSARALEGAERIVGSALVRFSDGVEAALGEAGVVVDTLTLDAVGSSSHHVVAVSGRAPKDSTVRIEEDGVPLATLDVGRSGYYRTLVSLPDRGRTSTHDLQAVTDGDAPLHSQVRTVAVDLDEPQMTRITVRQDGRDPYSWDPRDGVARFPYVFAPYLDLVVDVAFDQPEKVESVTVHVGADTIDAVWDESLGLFTGRTKSDGRGDISVEYTLADDLVLPLPTTPLDQEEVDTRLARAGATVTRAEQTDEGALVVEGTLPLGPGETTPGTFTSELTVRELRGFDPTGKSLEETGGIPLYDMEIEFLDEDPDDDTVVMVVTGVVPLDGDEPVPGYVQPAGDDGADSGRVVLGAPGATYIAASAVGSIGKAAWGRVTQTVTATAKGLTKKIEFEDVVLEQSKLQNLTKADALAGDAQAGKNAMQTADKYEKAASLFDDLADCPETPRKDQWRKRAETLNYVAAGYEVFGFGLAIAGTVVGGPLGGWAGIAVGEAVDFAFGNNFELVIEAMRAKLLADCVRDQQNEDENVRVCDESRDLIARGIMKGPQSEFCRKHPGRRRPRNGPPGPAGSPVWLHDPSGFVYEGVASRRVSGVSATLLYSQTERGPWQVWGAGPFGQINPQTTGLTGNYAWDVPEGFWQVVWEAPGFATARSKVLEVLPPHVDVHAGLLSLSAPTVASVTGTNDRATVRFDLPVLADEVIDRGLLTLRASDGSVVAATVTAVGAEVAPGYPKGPDQPHAGRPLATTFEVVPAVAPSGPTSYTVAVAPTVEAYNERVVGAVAPFAVTIGSVPTPTPPPAPAPGPTPTVPTPVPAPPVNGPACPQGEVARFADVPATSVHGASIGCAVARGLARGVGGGRFAPGQPVTRGQAASFLAGLVGALGGELPVATVTFRDVPSTYTHADAIGRLATAGIVGGVGRDRFAPDGLVTRAQMASMVAAAWGHATGEPLAAGRDAFDDDRGNVHERAIDAVAAAGIASGVGPRRFAPTQDVRRDQMVTFLVNALTRASGG